MRKFLALALAVAMVLSLASVSFAAVMTDTFDKALDYSGDADKVKYNKTYDTPDGQYTIDNDNMIEYGDTAYFPLVDEAGAITDYDRVEKLKVKAEFEMGEDLVESVSIVKKPVKSAGDYVAGDYAITADDITVDLTKFSFELNGAGDDIVVTYDGTVKVGKMLYASEAAKDAVVARVENALAALDKDDFKFYDDTYSEITGTDRVNNFDDIYSFEVADADTVMGALVTAATSSATAVGGDYFYFLAVKIKKVETTADADVIGTFEFKRNADNKKNIAKIDKEKYDFAINVWYDGNYADDDSGVTPYTVDDEVTLKWDDMYVLKFENDDEITINFGTDDNEGEFEVDVSGQGKLLVNFNTKANEAIADANPGVKMYFVNFNGAKFNRTGTFEYEMDDMVAAYKVVDDKLVEINGLEISGDTATFSTNTLGNYVFADAELVNPVVEAAVEAPAATNPATGGK